MPREEVWDEYPEVYHYTNFSTLPLIIHGASLRATRFDLLNDTQEIKYAKHIIAEKILERVKGATLEQVFELIELFYQTIGEGFYITSFCGKNAGVQRDNGLLSMWRHYGSDGGCAIVFKTCNIYHRSRGVRKFSGVPSACVMDKVIYRGENDSDPVYCERLDRFVTYASEKLVNPTPNSDEQHIYETEKIIKDLINLLICSKHPTFYEEHEVRIGMCFLGKPDEARPFSQQRFHEIPFSPSEDISRVIVGPHRDQNERYNFLESYLSQIKPKIEIVLSEIPLRF
jgi:hypothetical protein